MKGMIYQPLVPKRAARRFASCGDAGAVLRPHAVAACQRCRGTTQAHHLSCDIPSSCRNAAGHNRCPVLVMKRKVGAVVYLYRPFCPMGTHFPEHISPQHTAPSLLPLFQGFPSFLPLKKALLFLFPCTRSLFPCPHPACPGVAHVRQSSKRRSPPLDRAPPISPGDLRAREPPFPAFVDCFSSADYYLFIALPSLVFP